MKRVAFRRLMLLMSLIALESGVTAPDRAPIRFQDVSKQAGLTPLIVSGSREKNYVLEVNGSGVCWFDYDNDGYVDLYLVNGATLEYLQGRKGSSRPPNYLFRNNRDGTFRDVTRSAGVPGTGWGFGCVAADYDNDGDTDLFITNFGPNVLYRNNGNGTFSDVTQPAGVGGGDVWHTGAAFADYDNDGYLDLYVAGYLEFDVRKPRAPAGCTYQGLPVKACGPRGFPGAPDALYQNLGNGAFQDVTAAAGVVDRDLYYGFAVIFDDLTGDGLPDIFVANDSHPNYLYRNKGGGKFEDIGVVAGVAYSLNGKEHSNMGVAAADYDNNGLVDLFITTFADDNYALFRNDGKGFFTDVSYPSGIGEATIPWLGWATFFLDYNNDGWKDLFAVNGHVYPEVDAAGREQYRQPLQIFRNMGNRRFQDVSSEAGLNRLPKRSGRGGAFCDYDNDGGVDIVVSNIDDRPSLLRNAGGNRSNWLLLKLVGTASNRDGIGGRVKVTAGELTQYDHVRAGGSFLSSNDIRLHFGLGAAARADVEVRWPSGRVESLTGLPANSLMEIREGQGARPIRNPR